MCALNPLPPMERFAQRSRVAAEGIRKLIHVGIGLTAIVCSWFWPLPWVASVAALAIPVPIMTRHLGWIPSIHNPARESRGELYLLLGIIITAAVAPTPASFSFGVLVMALSDSAAGLVGMRFGRNHFRIFGADKTYQGSAAFFVVTLVLVLLFLLPHATDVPFAMFSAVTISALLALVEAASGLGLDNLFVTCAGALLLALAVGD